MRIVVGVTGASGAIYALRLLEKLRRPGLEIHLILSRSGEKTLFLETGRKSTDLRVLADFSWPADDVSAPLASGSFQTAGMIIAPCSVNTMSSIACGVTASLLTRAADVTLKERRPLVLMVRESPLHLGHLRTMTSLAEMGAILAPPVPGFYNQPTTIQDLVDASIERVLDLVGLPAENAKRWNGPRRSVSGAEGRES